jgi:hypothetical protein
MTQTLRDLMEANDEEPDQHVRETFEIEGAYGESVLMDIIGHYDGRAEQKPESTTVRVWNPVCTQPFIDRPFEQASLLFHQEIEDYRQVPVLVNATIDTIQTDGVDSLGADAE